MDNWTLLSLINLAYTVTVESIYRLFSIQSSTDVSDVDLPALQRRARIVDWVCLPFFFATVGGLTYSWNALFQTISDRGLAALPEAQYLLAPVPRELVYFAPALLLGITTSILPLGLAIRLTLGRKRFREYQLGSPSQIDASNGMLRATVFVGCYLSAAAFLVMDDWYIRFETERIAVNPLLSYGEAVYSYGDIQALIETSHVAAPIGMVVHERRTWHIHFRDGRHWCNEDLPEPKRRVDIEAKVRAMLVAKTGLPFRQAKLIGDALAK